MIEVRKRTSPHYPKSHTRALLLCCFLGYFGIHRFYTGYKRIGFIQLLTLGGFGLWWLIDLVSLCFNTYKDKYGIELDDYNKLLAPLVLSGIAVLGLVIGFFTLLPTVFK